MTTSVRVGEYVKPTDPSGARLWEDLEERAAEIHRSETRFWRLVRGSFWARQADMACQWRPIQKLLPRAVQQYLLTLYDFDVPLPRSEWPLWARLAVQSDHCLAELRHWPATVLESIRSSLYDRPRAAIYRDRAAVGTYVVQEVPLRDWTKVAKYNTVSFGGD